MDLRSLAGDWVGRWFIWDEIRALDVLLAQEGVDPARVGVTGNSGGGTMSVFAFACDPRITLAAPSCWVSSWYAQVIVTNTAAVALTGDFAYDFATSGNIEGGGEVRVQNATGVTFPDPFAIGERFRLGLDVPITAVGNWTIATNGMLTHGAVAYNNLMNSATQPDPATKLFLTLTGDLTIANGGKIDVDGKGHGAGRGEGRGGGSHRVAAVYGGAVDVATGAQLDLNGHQLTVTALTVAGTAYGAGEYAAADLGTEVIDSDPGVDGRVVVAAKGTLLLLR